MFENSFKNRKDRSLRFNIDQLEKAGFEFQGYASSPDRHTVYSLNQIVDSKSNRTLALNKGFYKTELKAFVEGMTTMLDILS